jgi:8-oxo-dGTP pyrophosphatase MutT (NUDIX family)
MSKQTKCNHKICNDLHDKKKKYSGAGVIIGTIKDEKVHVLLGYDKEKQNFTFFSGKYEEKESLYKPECYIETARRELEEEAKLKFELDPFIEKINNGTPQLNKDNGGAVFLAPIEYAETEKLDKLVKNAYNDKSIQSHLKEMQYLQYFCIEDTDEIEKNKDAMYTWAYNIISNNKKLIIDTVKTKLNSTTAPVEQDTKPDTTKKQMVTTNAKPNTGQTSTTEETILYVDTKSSNPNMMVSTIQLNPYFKKYTKKNGTWTEDAKGGNKRKSKSTKKARRSK